MLYYYVYYFLIYAFLGWCTEVAFAAIKTGQFINRGFLNGPVCPIYGAGVSAVAFCLAPVSDNVFLLIFGAMALTTLLEFITGYVLEKVYHTKWWDYSNRLFNIKGYICLEFSVIWGIACAVVIKFIHPIITTFVKALPYRVGVIVLIILSGVMIVDFIITVAGMRRIRTASHILDKISVELRELSDKLGEEIFKGVTDAKELKETIEEKTVIDDIIREKIANAKLNINKYIHSGETTRERLVKAFPNLKNAKQHSVYERSKILRERFNKNR